MPGFFTRGGGRYARPPSRIEEVFYPAVLADPNVDADGLTDLLRDPSPLLADEPDDWRPPAPVAEPQPEHLAVRVAKLAALVTAVALLCAAIVAAAFLDRQRRSTPPPGEPTTITGVRALAGIAPDGGVTAAPAPAAQRPGGAASSQGAIHTSLVGATDPCELAREFYRLIAERPDAALSMLGGSLSDDERRELAVAWREVDRVEVHDLRRHHGRDVRAVVEMITSAAERYLVDHLLLAAPPKITEVRLLSSQRLAPGHERVQIHT
ncbi:MAG: hypothetical protein ACRDQB_03915, partial [Thermocrispum sp.]